LNIDDHPVFLYCVFTTQQPRNGQLSARSRDGHLSQGGGRPSRHAAVIARRRAAGVVSPVILHCCDW